MTFWNSVFMKWLLNIFYFLILAWLHFSPCESFICYADTMATCWSAKFTSPVSTYSHRYREPLLTSLYIYIQVDQTCKIWKGQWIFVFAIFMTISGKSWFLLFSTQKCFNLFQWLTELSAPLHSWNVCNPCKIIFYLEYSLLMILILN